MDDKIDGDQVRKVNIVLRKVVNGQVVERRLLCTIEVSTTVIIMSQPFEMAAVGTKSGPVWSFLPFDAKLQICLSLVENPDCLYIVDVNLGFYNIM